jgi:predicted  nucleic acid-binding Zn-ribbon protein
MKSTRHLFKSAVESHLSSEGVLSEIIAWLTVEIKTIVEKAMKAGLQPLSNEVSRLQNKVIDLRTKLRELDKNIADRTDDLEQYQRRSNLRIFGIEETSAEDTDALIQLCSEKLGIEMRNAICQSHHLLRKIFSPLVKYILYCFSYNQ